MSWRKYNHYRLIETIIRLKFLTLDADLIFFINSMQYRTKNVRNSELRSNNYRHYKLILWNYSITISCITYELNIVPLSILGILPFIQPLISPIGNNSTESAITPPILLPPFLQKLKRKGTLLLSTVLANAFVMQIFPALPHEPFDSTVY